MTGKKISLLFFMLAFVFGSQAQQVQNVDFIVKDNILVVSYDLVGCLPKQLHDIKLSIICDGKTVDAVSLSGDLKKVSCGTSKKIEWNVLNDKTELKGKTQVTISISKTYSTKVEGGPSNAFLSMLLPGVGDYFVSKPNKTWYYISALYLGSAYYACSNKIQSNKFYDQYHKASLQNEMDVAYKQANDKYQTFQLMLGVMGAIWVADVVYVTIKGFKNRKEQLNGLAYKEPTLKFYFAGTTNKFQFGFVKKF